MQTKVERQHDKEPPETGPYIFPSLAQSPCSIVFSESGLRLAKAAAVLKSEQYVQQINLYPPSFRAYIPPRFAFSSPIDICSSNSLTIAFFAAIMEVEEKAAASPLSPMGPMES